MSPVDRQFYDAPSAANFAQLQDLTIRRGATAFLGAGLSQPAGLPGWTRLYRIICEEARGPGDPECQDLFPAVARRDLTGYRDTVGEPAGSVQPGDERSR